MTYNCQLAIYYFLHIAAQCMEEPRTNYAQYDQITEATELSQFVREASALNITPPPPPADVVRITAAMRIYIGEEELKLRPMSKAVLLLFLRHPEGIPLKEIGNYRDELTRLYSLVSRAGDRERIHKSVNRVIDIFSNELNVNISRVNSALSALKEGVPYHIDGRAGERKSFNFLRVIVIWE